MVLGHKMLLKLLGFGPPPASSTEDEAKAMQGKLLGLAGGVMCTSSMHIGYKLGFFEALKSGPLTVEALTKAAGAHGRYVKEWCLNMASNGFINFDAATAKYSMSDAQATFFVDKSHPNHSIMGAVLIAMASCEMRGRLMGHFQNGGGYTYKEMPPDAVLGCKIFFGPVYEGLLPMFVAKLDNDILGKLEVGIRVADVGCGCGKSTLVMGRLYPKSTFQGFDFDERAIAIANTDKAAERLNNVTFQVVDSAHEGSAAEFDLVQFFDCLHDMNDPKSAVAQAFKILKPGGSVFLIEPLAAEADGHAAALEMPMTAVYSGFGIHACIPSGLSEGGAALGGGMGPTCPTCAFDDMFKGAGFTSFKNLGIEAAANAGFRVMQAVK
mmetsp:Transcript_32342/g.81600  ORF Transcript_32342/g.81600 Transcript_32342/m.81600 type:complete len:381 (-) Transcript_32342:194-1336(-)